MEDDCQCHLCSSDHPFSLYLGCSAMQEFEQVVSRVVTELVCVAHVVEWCDVNNNKT